MALFRIEVIVDGKKLPDALTSLAGIGYDLRVNPVVNAAPAKNGRLRETNDATTGSGVLAACIQGAKNAGIHTISRKQIAAAAESSSASVHSAYTAIVRACADGSLKTTNNRGVYKIA